MEKRITSISSIVHADSSQRQVTRGHLVSKILLKQIESANYYQRLGVSKDASVQGIRSAYKSLARLIHPDKYKTADANRLFQRLTTAHECLINSDKRSAYDANISVASSPINSSQADIDSDDEFDIQELYNDHLLFFSTHGFLHPLDGFDQFKDDLHTRYHLKYFDNSSKKSICLKSGFNLYLRSFLDFYDFNYDDIKEKYVSVLYDSALVHLQLKPTIYGHVKRTIYASLPITFRGFDENFIRVKYGEEWQGVLSFLNHPNRQIMQPKLPNHDKHTQFLNSLKTYLLLSL